MDERTKRRKLEQIAGELTDLICHLNPHLRESDVRDGVAAQHLINIAAHRLSNGWFGKHPRQLDDLLYHCNGAEDFIRCLDSVNFEMPTARELLDAIEDIKYQQTNETVYAEGIE